MDSVRDSDSGMGTGMEHKKCLVASEFTAVSALQLCQAPRPRSHKVNTKINQLSPVGILGASVPIKPSDRLWRTDS